MIKIIAHRGLWTRKEEKNSLIAFERALQNGFSVETDFRDFDGRLVVSHDIPDADALSAEVFFELCNQYPEVKSHAINIKADGLQNLLGKYLRKWSSERYFIFDMTIPEALIYLNAKLNVFVRVSEFEEYNNLNHDIQGIWVDAFRSEWYEREFLETYLNAQKSIVIVSPELHGRDHRPLWSMIKSCYSDGMALMLCTDLPIEANNYFNDKN